MYGNEHTARCPQSSLYDSAQTTTVPIPTLKTLKKGNGVKLLSLLAILAFGEAPAAPRLVEEPPPDLSAYVYLHVTRNEVSPAAMPLSCPGRFQAVRS
jgi:hypothetical protein